ncbi:MAG TPA: Mur ligase family protein [Mycobacteriales bacterium]|nr:Mur ligase family protein [Mycobacteriales bacterium]
MPHRPDPAPPALVELRLLDGPNLYFARAACKVVLDVSGLLLLPEEELRDRAAAWGTSLGRGGTAGSEVRARAVSRVLAAVTRRLAATAGVARLAVRSRPGPEPAQLTIAFPWRRRELARALGVALAEAVDGTVGDLSQAPHGTGPTTPRPRIPVVAVTGTNGKTTTTRLIAHMSRCAGNVTGWTSTDGVYVDGVAVEEGDWSGYGGAGRVLGDRRVQLAVLETARGGLLLRGAGTRHNDVSVVTNVGADHLGLQGIHTVDDLAEVKAVVPRLTREGGWCVVNAQDPRVLAMRSASKGRPWAFSLDPDAPGVRAVLAEGGRATSVLDEQVVLLDGEGGVDPLVPLADVPMTLAGLSRHDVANALAAASAGLAVGLPRHAVVQGLRTFTAEQNPGRMNLWDVRGCVVVLDLAHNEDSLQALLAVVRGLRVPGGRVVTVLGTGGDRLDEQLRELGHLARHGSDEVVLALKSRYLRGRSPEDMLAQLRAGAGDAPAHDDEVTALRSVLLDRRPEDAVAFLCHQDRPACEQVLREAGGHPMSVEEVRARVLRGRGRP